MVTNLIASFVIGSIYLIVQTILDLTNFIAIEVTVISSVIGHTYHQRKPPFLGHFWFHVSFSSWSFRTTVLTLAESGDQLVSEAAGIIIMVFPLTWNHVSKDNLFDSWPRSSQT